MTTMLNQSAPAAVAPKQSHDSGHWYAHNDAAGWHPLYTPDKNYTLRQARVDKLAGVTVVPSVTTIFSVLAKPQLDRWKQANVAKACWDISQSPLTMDMDTYIEQAIDVASNASKGAMDLGTRIHKAIEDCLGGQDYDADLQQYVGPVMAKRAEMGVTKSVTEATVGSAKYGYAGRCDDHSEDGMVIRDFKSRKSTGKKKVATYETDAVQLAAYGFARFGNDFFQSGRGEVWGISTSEPGLLTVHTFTGPELVRDFECFLSLCSVWRHVNNFDPRVNP